MDFTIEFLHDPPVYQQINDGGHRPQDDGHKILHKVSIRIFA